MLFDIFKKTILHEITSNKTIDSGQIRVKQNRISILHHCGPSEVAIVDIMFQTNTAMLCFPASQSEASNENFQYWIDPSNSKYIDFHTHFYNASTDPNPPSI